MPLFEYKCSNCHSSFEKLVMTSKRDDVDCKDCGSDNTQRQISSFAAKTTSGGSVSIPAGPAPRFS